MLIVLAWPCLHILSCCCSAVLHLPARRVRPLCMLCGPATLPRCDHPLHALAMQHGTPFILLAALRSLRNGDWRSVAISSGEAALFAALTKVVRHRSATYLRHRSLLLTLVYLGHFTASSGLLASSGPLAAIAPWSSCS